MIRRLTTLLAAAAALVSGCAREQPDLQPGEPFAVSLAVSTNTLRIGDPASLRLYFTRPSDSAFSIEEPSSTESFYILHRSENTRPTGSTNELRTDTVYQFTSFQPGSHEVFTGAVTFTLADGTTRRSFAPPVTLNVISVLTNETPVLADNIPNTDWPAARKPYLLGFLALALVAVAAALLAARFIPRTPREIIQPPPPPAHETALRELRQLRGRKWIEQLNIEPFFVELSRIVRHYLEGRFELRAPELTTEEFIREAAGSQVLTAEHKMLTRSFLEQCDLVKFALHRPGIFEMEKAFEAAEKLVKETMPVAPHGQEGGVA